ncbi:MAG: immunoglobulin domain-containing protein [Verrucomicrobiota bacterium]
MVILNAGTTVAQQFSNPTNTFSGQWILQCGWLLGTTNNSLGTNNITVDPGYTGELAAMPNFVANPGATRFEVNYDLNSAGTLTLINGGQMRLHQNIIFSAANINGTPLSLGTHYFAELITTFPDNFATGGSGSITIQPYGPPPAFGPQIVTQPLSEQVYAGRTARFSVVASTSQTGGPLSYQWRKEGAPLTEGGNIRGSTSTNLVISNVSASDAGIYDVLVSNTGGSQLSVSVSLAIASSSGEAFESAVVSANPIAFYQLNETADPATNNALAFDFVGGYSGIYGNAVQNGSANYNIAGPRPADALSGFAANNAAGFFQNGLSASFITAPALNLNTNAVTLIAWINPAAAHAANEGVIFSRSGSTVSGLSYLTDLGGNQSLSYNWNNEASTYTWGFGLTNVTPAGQWSMVALVVTPTNASIYVMNTNGLIASPPHIYSHVNQAFEGATLIGNDSFGANGTRVFNGSIDDVAVFNRSLTQEQLLSLYSAASGTATFAPNIGVQPASQTLYEQQTARFTAVATGTEPIIYQWKAGSVGSGVYTNLSNGGQFSGVDSATLTLSNISMANAADYIVSVTNPVGTAASTAATLTVLAAGPALNFTLGVQQAAGLDWDSPNSWSDGTGNNTLGVGASISAASNPGSTYELLPGSRLRTPPNSNVATFPGNQLTLDGDGVWVLNPGAGATLSEIRFKQPLPGRVNFPRLIMNGGQLDTGNDGLVSVGGRIDILANTPFNNDGGSDRGYIIDALLTGAGNIEFHGYNQVAFQASYTNNLNIAGNANTFSGKWNVVTGVLLGTGANALGTNDMIVGGNGAMEATYNINNPNGNLILNGKMFLHQNHTFRTVSIGSATLGQGTFTFAQLAATYPANFPSSWTQQAGSSFSTGSGSITVLAQAGPAIITQPASMSLYPSETAQFSVLAVGFQPLSYQWRKGGVALTDGVTASGSIISGSTTTNLTVANVANGDAGNYTVTVSNSVSTTTSNPALLTIKPTSPAENITLNYGGIPLQQAIGQNWNTITNWSDGLAASESALSKPGSTYDVIPGARLRSPEGVAVSTFPGNMLTVEGDGIWVNNPAGGSTLGELRFKQPIPGTVGFKKLVLNGGQLDLGNDGVVVLTGELNVRTNSSLNNNSAADRGFQIDSWLTGTGAIEYHAYQAAFNPAFVNNLNLTGTSNTFSGKWNVVVGVLLGSGTNSLGTNDIAVGVDGALETLYNINNPNGNLVLAGQFFLHQDDVFRTVTVGGAGLAAGTYTFTQLNTAYPTLFPALWTQQNGSGFSTGSGSITVLASAQGPTITVQRDGTDIQLIWSQGALQEAVEVTGPWITNPSAVSPFTVTPSDPKKFYRLIVQ